MSPTSWTCCDLIKRSWYEKVILQNLNFRKLSDLWFCGNRPLLGLHSDHNRKLPFQQSLRNKQPNTEKQTLSLTLIITAYCSYDRSQIRPRAAASYVDVKAALSERLSGHLPPSAPPPAGRVCQHSSTDPARLRDSASLLWPTTNTPPPNPGLKNGLTIKNKTPKSASMGSFNPSNLN